MKPARVPLWREELARRFDRMDEEYGGHGPSLGCLLELALLPARFVGGRVRRWWLRREVRARIEHRRRLGWRP